MFDYRGESHRLAPFCWENVQRIHSLSRTFSRHGKMKASFLLLIWLNEKVFLKLHIEKRVQNNRKALYLQREE